MTDWQRIWNEDDAIHRFSPTRGILYFFSLFYRLIVRLRNRLYDRQILKPVKLSCPVISVGNITVGGTGKTPCVIMLAKMIQQLGWQPAVISRGYGGKSTQTVNVVSDGKNILLGAEAAGDEPLLIARSLPDVPVLTGAKRALTGQAAIDRFGANVLICDDAFQHRQIFRDLDIVLLDSEKPLGNRHLLPRGELRESKEGLNRADCIILTRADEATHLNQDVARIADASRIPVFRSDHCVREMISSDASSRLSPDELRGRKVCAFCGIAKPASFKKLLIEAGADIVSFIAFPDHYAYNHYDLDGLTEKFQTLNADYWITTEKDAMRLTNHSGFLKMIRVLCMEMKMQPSGKSFEKFIVESLAAATCRG